MWSNYIFNYEIDEIPYAVWDGEIKYYNEQVPNYIKLKLDICDNIDFDAGITGFGYCTDDIKDYTSLLAFLEDHYDEIEENDDTPYTNKECIDELIEICKEKIK